MDRLHRKGLFASHNLWLTAAIVIVIAIAIYSKLDAEAFRDAAGAATRSRAVMENSQRLFSLLRDAESGHRSYLLTGEPRYLDAYNQTLPKLDQAMLDLAATPSAAPADLSRLASLVRSELVQLAQNIRIRQQGDEAAALEIIRTDRGKPAMDELHALSAHIIEREYPRLEASRASAMHHGYQTRVLVQFGAIALACLLFLANRRINHLLHSQERLIDDLDATREREARGRSALATTLRSIGDAVITTNEHDRVQFVNPVAEELTGWTAAAASSRLLPDVFRIQDEATRLPAEDLSARVLRERSVVSLANRTILISREEREIPIDVSAAAIHDEPGGIAGVVLVFRDVTLRRRAQRELEDSESRYRLLFEANPAPMWVFDVATLAFLAVNGAAIAHYGYTADEFLGMTLRDIRPPEDVPALLEEIRATTSQPHTDGPWRHRKKDGSLIFVEITAHPLRFGNTDACLVMVTDITGRRELEEKLRQSQKLEAVGQLAGGIAHDFNNLLTVIEGYAEMLLAAQAAGDSAREPLEEILVAAQRAASLTRQLLAFSRRQVLQSVRLSLNANVGSTQRMLSRLLGENIQIKANLAQDLWDVWADPGQIDQIILNLAVNARDAMEHGGTLTLETANLELPEGEARTLDAASGQYAALSIADTGIGMDTETRRRIFEPFFTTKEVGRGTGLGLSTVYGIVKQSGGFIRVDSQPGKGSLFTIALPRALGAPPVAAGPHAAGAQPAAGSTILVLEDDATVQQLVRTMLQSSGYRVLAASSPAEALHICGQPDTRIDLLLTDMVLPDGDGVAVAEKAAALRPGLKVIFMSGYTEHPVLRSPTFDRSVPFLQKPFSRTQLNAKILEALQSPSP